MSVEKTNIPSGDANLYKEAVNVTGLALTLINQNKDKFHAGDNVLDLGCGDGYATRKLMEACPGVKMTVADYSPSMVKSIKETIPGITALEADAGNLPIGKTDALQPASFDEVFSLSALHWVRNFPGLIKGIATLLKPGGKLITEFAYESPKELRHAVEQVILTSNEPDKDNILERVLESDPWQKSSAIQWHNELQKNGFLKDSIKIAEVTRSQPLSGDEGMKKWLKMFAMPFFTPILEKETSAEARNAKEEEIIEKLDKELRKEKYGLYNPAENIDNPWHIKYYRLNVNASMGQEITLTKPKDNSWQEYLARGTASSNISR